jgi:hypothetical protein
MFRERINKLVVWLYVVRISCKWIFNLHLGRNVWWRGEKWILIQGVCRPKWNLFRDGIIEENVHEYDFRIVNNPIEWRLAFLYGYRFYMSCWYRIWVEEKNLGKSVTKMA